MCRASVAFRESNPKRHFQSRDYGIENVNEHLNEARNEIAVHKKI
jgi:hypothetical protein